MTAPAGEWNTRSLFRLTGTTVLLPNLLYGVGQGAIIPIIPLFASQIGASLAAAALAAAMLTMGQLVASLPAPARRPRAAVPAPRRMSRSTRRRNRAI